MTASLPHGRVEVSFCAGGLRSWAPRGRGCRLIRFQRKIPVSTLISVLREKLWIWMMDLGKLRPKVLWLHQGHLAGPIEQVLPGTALI